MQGYKRLFLLSLLVLLVSGCSSKIDITFAPDSTWSAEAQDQGADSPVHRVIPFVWEYLITSPMGDPERVTPTHFPPPIQMIEPTATPMPEPSTALFFTWDDSGSILKPKFCGGENAAARVTVPRFLASLFTIMEIDTIQLGLGSSAEQVPLYNIQLPGGELFALPWDQWQNKNESELDTETDYGQWLDHASESFRNINAEEKLLIILSDGFLTKDRSETGKQLITDRMIELSEQGFEISVLLLCPETLQTKQPDDYEFWGELDEQKNVNIVTNGEPELWVKDIFTTVQGHFNAFQVKWVDTDGVNDLATIRGDARAIRVGWFPYSEGYFHLTVDGTPVQTLYPFFSTIYFDVKPDCSPFSVGGIATSGTSGLVWVLPELPELRVDIPELSPIVNNNSVEIKTILTSTSMTPNALLERSHCYRLSPEIVSSVDSPDQTAAVQRMDKCTNGYLCRGADQLYAEWQWQPIPPNFYEGPGTVLLQVLLEINGAEQTNRSIVASKRIPVLFSPEFDRMGNFEVQTTKPYDVYFFEYFFRNDVSLPRVGLVSPGIEMLTKGSKELAGQGVLCPSPKDGEELLWLNLDAPITNTNYASFQNQDDPVGRMTVSYLLRIGTFMHDICGYQEVVFDWSESGNSADDPRRWLCPISVDHHQQEVCTLSN